MADYWKSQEKKYCDFCKCWIADNKPSRDFHENGRRHKENVKKRLEYISRKSAQDQRDAEKVDAQIRRMENAALHAYQKDVENNGVVELTSIQINKHVKEANLEIKNTSFIPNRMKLWHEAVAKDGKSYYWNTMTNETRWTRPKEGFYTIMQQKSDQNRDVLKKAQEAAKYYQKETALSEQAKKRAQEEERARIEREKLKSRRVKQEDDEEDTCKKNPTFMNKYCPILEPGKTNPYGRWEVVKQEEENAKSVDWQLPEVEYFEPPVVVEPEPILKEFKEKTVENLHNSAQEKESAERFKKRKNVAVSKQRNLRQRFDEDE